jgi:hypothetical protein
MKKTAVFTAIALFVGAMAAPARAFTHPGIPLTATDLQAIKDNLGNEPWKSGYAMLAADWHSQLTYTMQGPFANVSRNPNVNLTQWRNDMIAIWNLSRMWYFTGDTQYAQKAHDILLAWANTQTSFTGIENALDLGDYAYRWAGGAEILRSTWPGWTTADTTAVKALFGNVYQTINSTNSRTLGPTNKGSLALAASIAAAVFCDDQALFDHSVWLLRTCASTGFANSLSNGEHGETGRDQGHSYAHLLQMSFMAEILWKQGIDIYAERDNRLLAMGEYYGRYNLSVNTPFIPMGTTDEYYMGNWAPPGYAAEPMAFSILRSAYVLRKGMSSPYLVQKLAAQGVNMDSFMFLKPYDTSTATPLAPISTPAASRVSTGLTSADIGGATPAGSTSYSNGVWTVAGAGTNIWTGGPEKYRFVYKQVTGDFSLVARVDSVQCSITNAKAGVMLSSDLNADPGGQAWTAITPAGTIETYYSGWTEMYGGSNWQSQIYGVPIPWWIKIERIGNMVTTYGSPDGVSWAVQVNGAFDNMPTTAYIGLCLTSMADGTVCTGEFSNVSITGGNGAAPVAAPAAPLAIYASPGEGQVPLRWCESFGATNYKVKRATTSGGPYTTIATVTNPSYVDTAVTNDTTYYYVVSATNSVGEGANSPEDSAKPTIPLINITSGGTANDSINNPDGAEGAAKAFDGNTGTKWLCNAVSWLQYDFGAGVTQTVKRYDITSANDVPARDPKDWQLQGSNDGSTWTTVDTRTGQPSWPNRYQTISFTVATPGAYRYYRLNVTANNGDSGTQLSELAFYSDGGHTIPNGTYRIVCRRSSRALDVQNGGTANGSLLVQWGINNASSQKWTLADQGNGQYRITNVPSGRVMDVAEVSTANGAAIHLWDWLNQNNQKWTITPVGNGCFKLTAVHSGKLADVNGGSTADGATIIQWPFNGGTNQQWFFLGVAP